MTGEVLAALVAVEVKGIVPLEAGHTEAFVVGLIPQLQPIVAHFNPTLHILEFTHGVNSMLTSPAPCVNMNSPLR